MARPQTKGAVKTSGRRHMIHRCLRGVKKSVRIHLAENTRSGYDRKTADRSYS